MRRVRPTVRVLRLLPADSFGDPSHGVLIARNRWNDLAISQIEHRLLRDADSFFSRDRRPGTHETSSTAAGRPVFEVRSRTGAGWRGAVVLDEDGDPWLVHADRHDSFHSGAAQVFRTGAWMPSSADYKMRAREEAGVADRAWRASLLSQVLDGVRKSINSGRPTRLPLAGPTGEGPDRCSVAIDIDRDAPADEVALAHTTTTMVTVRLTLRDDHGKRIETAALQEVVPFLQPDAQLRDQAYGPKGELHVWMTVTHAQLIQILAAVELPSDELPGVGPLAAAPTHLHYVGARRLTEAFVVGEAVRAVCGAWFVPTRDEATAAGLSVCARCEAEVPIAQAVLALLRDRED